MSDYPETADIETSSDGYAERFSGEIGSWFLKIQEETTLRMLSSYPGASVLDVGGGHGQLTAHLIYGGYKVSVLGSSEICKERIRDFVEKGLCKFTTGNIIDLPFPDRVFDVVISFRLLPHVAEWKRLIKELTRVARNAVVVDFPTKQSLNYISPALFGFKKKLEGNTRPYTLFSESELREVFKLHNFVCSDRYAEFFMPMVLHRVLKSVPLSSSVEKACRVFGLTSLFGSPVILKLVREGLKTK